MWGSRHGDDRVQLRYQAAMPAAVRTVTLGTRGGGKQGLLTCADEWNAAACGRNAVSRPGQPYTGGTARLPTTVQLPPGFRNLPGHWGMTPGRGPNRAPPW